MTDFQAHRGDFRPGLQAESGRRIQKAASRRTGGTRAAGQAHDESGSAQNGGVKKPLPASICRLGGLIPRKDPPWLLASWGDGLKSGQ